MGFPTDTDFPGAVDVAESRTDYVDFVWAVDFDFQDKQIRKIQNFLGETGKMIGENIAGAGPVGMVSPVASGGTAFRLAARDNFVSGTLLSVEDNFDVAAVQVARLNYAGLLWTLGGLDISSSDFLHLPTGGVLPVGLAAGDVGRMFYKTGALDGLYAWDGAAWRLAGAGVEQLDITAYSYLQTDPSIEETLNYGYFNGTTARNPVFWGILTPSISVPGTTYLRIYDVGPAAGPPVAPVLVAELSTITSGGPQYLEQTLVVGAGPALNQIQNTARLYSVRAYQLSTNGDTVLVGAGGLADR